MSDKKTNPKENPPAAPTAAIDTEKYAKQISESFEAGLRINPVSTVLKDAHDRLMANAAYRAKLDVVRKMVDRMGRDIVDAVDRRLKKEKEVKGDTRRLLHVLDESVRFVGMQVKAAKMKESPYSARDAEGEVLELKELNFLEGQILQMRQINIEELVDIFYEDSEFFEMAEQERIVRFEEKPNKPKDWLNPELPSYEGALKSLVNFIRGRHAKNPSGLRKKIETSVWMEAVGNMDEKKQGDLFRVFLNSDAAPDEIKRFMFGSVLRGAMTRRDIMRIYDANRDTFERVGKKEDVDKFLQKAVQYKDYFNEQMEEQAKQEQEPRIQNFMQYLIRWPVIFGEFMTRTGGLIIGANVLGNVVDRITSRKEGSSVFAAIGKGVIDSTHDKHVLFGAALAAGGAQLVWPYMHKIAYGESNAEKRLLANYREAQILKEQAGNHPAALNYLVQHYDELLEISGLKEPTSKRAVALRAKPGRGPGDLMPGDIEMSDEKAKSLGYPTAQYAEGMLMRLFQITAKVFGKKTTADLKKFLEDKHYV